MICTLRISIRCLLIQHGSRNAFNLTLNTIFICLTPTGGKKKKKKKSYHLTSEEYIYWLNEEKQKKLRFTFHVGAHFGKLYKHQGSYSSLDVWADGDIYFISGFDIKKQQFQIHARIISWKQLYTSPKKKQIGLVSSQSDFMYKTGRHCRNGCTLKYLLL